MRYAPCVLFVITLLFAQLSATGSTQENKAVQTKKVQNMQAQVLSRIYNPDTMAKPTVGYSQVAEVTDGKIVYIAGQVALDRSGKLVGKDDFRAQVQQVFENLKAAVTAAGGALAVSSN